jgi:hypothetical protein
MSGQVINMKEGLLEQRETVISSSNCSLWFVVGVRKRWRMLFLALCVILIHTYIDKKLGSFSECARLAAFNITESIRHLCLTLTVIIIKG